MNWNFEELLSFLCVMEVRSLTGAAAQMNLSKSVLSRRLQNLERSLRVELFKRARRGLQPTEAADELYGYVRPLVREIQHAVEAVSAAPSTLSGHLRITGPVAFGALFLSSIVSEFCKLHPKLNVTLDLDDKLVDLTQASYDLGIRVGTSMDASLRARKLALCERVVCCSPDYAAKHGTPSSIVQLARHAIVGQTTVPLTQLWRFEPMVGRGDDGRRISADLTGRITSNSSEAIREAAIAGLGLAVLPKFFVADAIQNNELVVVLPEERLVPAAVYALYPKTRYVTPKVRAFIDYLVPTLPERLSQAQNLVAQHG